MKTLSIILAAVAIACTAIGCAHKSETTATSSYGSATMSTSK